MPTEYAIAPRKKVQYERVGGESAYASDPSRPATEGAPRSGGRARRAGSILDWLAKKGISPKHAIRGFNVGTMALGGAGLGYLANRAYPAAEGTPEEDSSPATAATFGGIAGGLGAIIVEKVENDARDGFMNTLATLEAGRQDPSVWASLQDQVRREPYIDTKYKMPGGAKRLFRDVNRSNHTALKVTQYIDPSALLFGRGSRFRTNMLGHPLAKIIARAAKA